MRLAHVIATSLVPLAVLLGGCSASTGSTDADATATVTSSGAVGTPASSPTWSSVEDRCYLDAPGRLTTYEGDDGTVLSGAVVGRGPVAAVFVHQTGGGGMCGWLPFAAWAARHGVRAVLVDACGYGASVCSDAVRTDPAAMLRIPVEWARSDGADRVTVVGASMGGWLVAVGGEAAGADAIVNLSGPRYWGGTTDIREAARSTTVPLLVSAADDDRGIDVRALRQSVRVSPASEKRYLPAPSGHGWGMLTEYVEMGSPVTPVGRAVLAWIKG
jgi:hypothetical protein